MRSGNGSLLRRISSNVFTKIYAVIHLQALWRAHKLNANELLNSRVPAAAASQMHLAKEELMRKTFDFFDRDGSGFITRQELREALSYQGPEVSSCKNADTSLKLMFPNKTSFEGQQRGRKLTSCCCCATCAPD